MPLEMLADVLFVPPLPESPHTTTLPSFFNAANAAYTDRIDTTPVSPAGTVPPLVALPQHTTVPSDFNAANAHQFEYNAIILTPDVNNAAELTGVLALLPYGMLFPHTTTVPSDFNAAKAYTFAHNVTTFVKLGAVPV